MQMGLQHCSGGKLLLQEMMEWRSALGCLTIYNSAVIAICSLVNMGYHWFSLLLSQKSVCVCLSLLHFDLWVLNRFDWRKYSVLCPLKSVFVVTCYIWISWHIVQIYNLSWIMFNEIHFLYFIPCVCLCKIQTPQTSDIRFIWSLISFFGHCAYQVSALLSQLLSFFGLFLTLS